MGGIFGGGSGAGRDEGRAMWDGGVGVGGGNCGTFRWVGECWGSFLVVDGWDGEGWGWFECVVCEEDMVWV